MCENAMMPSFMVTRSTAAWFSHVTCERLPQARTGLTVTTLSYHHSSPECHVSHDRKMALTNIKAS